MSDKVTEVYKRILELADTTLEGIEHICAASAEGHFEETVNLFTDVTECFHEMLNALATVLDGYEESKLHEMSEDVIKALQQVLSAYEGDKDVEPVEVLHMYMLPAYCRWYDELQNRLRESCAPKMH